MEIEELDVALDELEVRLERLRALYEQYFLGIEKLEPTIARKDVDRRIYVLRREKIRNTGRRFKLQTIIQRYNTFQQYWQRICREIENGTYRRHLIRAERHAGPSELLTVATRRRFGKERAASSTETGAQAEPLSAAPPSAPSAGSQEPSSPPAPRLETPTLPRGTRLPPLPPLAATPPSFSDRLDSAFPPPRTSSPKPSSVPSTPFPESAPRAPVERTPPAAARPAKSVPPKAYESLELDMDFMGDWNPSTGAGSASKPLATARGPALPSPITKTGAARPPATPAAPAEAAVAPAPALGARTAAPDATKLSTDETGLAATPPRRVPPPKPNRGAPAPAPSAPERKRPERNTHPGLAPPPPGTPAPPEAAPARPANSVPRPTRVEPPPSTLTEERLRTLHSRLAEANQKVSLQGLERSLRAAEAKLRTQHGNRRIDFEVVLKDGKPVVKPVVR
ncbi:MAG TPA: MXAN_5187 C-terminal domain-containing protein [Polyangiaceae bacterium]